MGLRRLLQWQPSINSYSVSVTASPTLKEVGIPGVTLAGGLFALLATVALICAFLTGLKTIIDPDFFWQLATGRWVAQHHHVFSTDVFSYTAAGQPWIYPVGSGLLFYGAYLIGGDSLLSWMGAAACCGTVALLLRKGSLATAAIAVVAVPLIANRTNPRAEMFTTLLFAAFLSILWKNYRFGRARLWLLPLLMIAWVNLHLGFASGVMLILAFVALDVLQMLRSRTIRNEAMLRLRHAAPWFVATGICTLANPWGWGIYTALFRQNRVMAEHSEWFAEWGKVPLNWAVVGKGLSPSNPTPFYLLLVIALIAIGVALRNREWGGAILLAGALYEGIQHLRMEALTACVVVIVGGSVLFPVVHQIGSRTRTVTRFAVATAAAVAVIALAVLWSSSALKGSEMSISAYGTGLGWWFPERAAEFVERANIPGELFNAYSEGGYVLWKLGPNRRDYIDGRAIPFGSGAFLHQARLLDSPPDATAWQTEADRYHINIILLPLNRFQSELGELRKFCNSSNWAPVYLDEISGVFVRRTSETEDLIRRSRIDCATASLPAAVPAGSANNQFNQWANAAVVLAALGRNLQALAAADKASEILPDSSFGPWLRGNVSYSMGLRSQAEQEYLKAIAKNPGLPLVWFSLATVYKHDGRLADTIAAQRKGIDLSTMPKPYELLKLARLYLDVQQPQAALKTFDEAARVASPDILASSGEHNFQFEVDQGRAAAWRALGDTKRASTFDQMAVQDLVSAN